jgi:hypothetical protein
MRLKPWNLNWEVRNFFRRISGRKTLEDERLERMMMLREMLAPGQSRAVKPGLTEDYFSKLADDFTVNNLTLAKKSGSVVASSGKGEKLAQEASAIFKAVESKIPDASLVMVKTKDRVEVVAPNNGSLVVVDSPGSISPIEVRALLKRIGRAAEPRE